MDYLCFIHIEQQEGESDVVSCMTVQYAIYIEAKINESLLCEQTFRWLSALNRRGL